MTPEQVTDILTDRLAERLVPAVDAVTHEIADDVRERISVPVGRSGSRIIRSRAGEPPRKEYGDYQKSWRTSAVVREGNTIRGAAGTPAELGAWLEHGTSRMEPRPHAGPAARAARTDFVSRLKSNL